MTFEIDDVFACFSVVEMMQLSDIEDTEVKEDTTDFVSCYWKLTGSLRDHFVSRFFYRLSIFTIFTSLAKVAAILKVNIQYNIIGKI
jgi:hypothetical protein